MVGSSMRMSIFLLLFLSIQPVAQMSDEVPQKTIFDRSEELPTDIAFRSVMYLLADFHEKGDDIADYLIEQKLGLGDAAASALIDRIIATRQPYQTEAAAAVLDNDCTMQGDPYEVSRRGYDIEESIATHHYEMFISDLEPSATERLVDWLEEAKGQTVYKQVDFENADQMLGCDPIERLTAHCAGYVQ